MENQAELSVSRAQSADAERVAVVARDTFAFACPDWADPVDVSEYIAQELTAEAFRRDLNTTGVAIYLAEQDDDVVGYAMLRGEEYPPVALAARRPVELRRLYLREAAQGGPAATQLLEACLRHGRTHGYDLLWLGTNQENERALRFYQRNGFSRVGERDFPVGRAVHRDYLLSRRLEPADTDEW
ncbi:MAG: GNAT family N-acetyltransferase [Actinomycetia bacterium]|nr:GNAT family N-acetyltransferase [Actinomycetes bacterium]